MSNACDTWRVGHEARFGQQTKVEHFVLVGCRAMQRRHELHLPRDVDAQADEVRPYLRGIGEQG